MCASKRSGRFRGCQRFIASSPRAAYAAWVLRGAWPGPGSDSDRDGAARAPKSNQFRASRRSPIPYPLRALHHTDNTVALLAPHLSAYCELGFQGMLHCCVLSILGHRKADKFRAPPLLIVGALCAAEGCLASVVGCFVQSLIQASPIARLSMPATVRCSAIGSSSLAQFGGCRTLGCRGHDPSAGGCFLW